MLSESMLNIFVRVVKRRMVEEEKTADQVLEGYPALTAEEKDEIKVNI